MPLRGWSSKEVLSPRGMWSILAQRRKGTPSRASFMQNMRVSPGVVATRPGTSAVISATGRITGIWNWLTPSGDNLVLYQEQDSIQRYRQSDGDRLDIMNFLTTSYCPSFADLDVWTYLSTFDTASDGVIEARVYDGQNLDYCFRGPLAFTDATAVDAGVGQCTAGTHYLGFIYQNRTGYAGIPTTVASYEITATSNTNPDVITAPDQNFQNGDPILISGSTGDTLINSAGTALTSAPGGPFSIANPGGFPIPGNGVYTGGGVVRGPMSVTLATGNRQINITITFVNPDDGGTDADGAVQAQLFPIMTRADNPAKWYYVPGAEQDVPVSPGSSTLTFVLNLSDEDMAAGVADSADDQFNLFARENVNTGVSPPPLLPSFVVAYGQRMCYGVGTALYASDAGNPQAIALDQNAVPWPSKRKIGFAFPLPNDSSLYITGDRWTSRVTDNSDIPSTWSEPVSVSPALGAPYPSCVCYRTKGNYAWVVTEAGPFIFDGQYGEKPLTYMVSDQWKRVNWNAAYAIAIADDVVNLKCYIAAPLDGATTPTHQFVIDYTNGLEFDKVDISLDMIKGGTGYASVGVVKEIATGITGPWFGPAAAGNIVRFDDSTHNDEGVAIDNWWESGLVRGQQDFQSKMIRIGAQDIWARGFTAVGNYLITIYGPDKVQSITPPLLSKQGVTVGLSPNPGIIYASKGYMNRIENYTIKFRTNAVSEWQEISGFTGYAKSSEYNR